MVSSDLLELGALGLESNATALASADKTSSGGGAGRGGRSATAMHPCKGHHRFIAWRSYLRQRP
jgi:hypothetical protein